MKEKLTIKEVYMGLYQNRIQTALCNHKVMTTTIKRVDNFVKSVYAIDKGVD